MPLLTAIEPTRRGRFALCADGEFLFSVDGETLANSGLREGDQVYLHWSPDKSVAIKKSAPAQ